MGPTQKVWPKPTNQPFQENLEYCCRDEAIEQANDTVIDVPERSDSDLHQEDEKDGYQSREQSSGPYRHDFIAKRVGELRIDNVSAWKIDYDTVSIPTKRVRVYQAWEN